MNPEKQTERRPSIAAVVVTYRPEAAILDHVRRIAEQVSEIIVVDNATDGAAAEWIEALAKMPGVLLIRNRANLGIAAALNIGVRRALQSGCSWIATFDQDTGIPKNYFNGLLEVYETCPDRQKAGMVVPGGWTQEGEGKKKMEDGGWRVEDGEGEMGKHSTFNIQHSTPKGTEKSGKAGNENRKSETENRPVLRSNTAESGKSERERPAWSFTVGAITSGSLIKAEIFEAAGFYDETLFIDYVDTDFCLRVQKGGYKILSVSSAFLEHELGQRQARHFFGLQISFRIHTAWRYYYIFRNRLLLYRRYWAIAPGWLLHDLRWLILEVGRIFLLEDGRKPKIRALMHGIKDGLRNKAGRHPDYPPKSS